MAIRFPMRKTLGVLSVLAAAVPWLACGDSTEPPVPASLSKVDGDAQTGVVGAPLTRPVAVEVRDARGNAVAGATVQFAVTSGGGSVSPSSVTTGANGRASATWTLGTNASATHTVRATVGSLSADFSATATPGPAATLVKVSGDAQTGEAGTALADSLVVRVTDRFGNPVAGTTLQWAVASGGGSLSPATSTSSSAGLARSRWMLGPSAGTQTATASASGLSGSPLTFTATATLATGPVVSAISPSPLTPGTTATITGANFSPTPSQNSVRIAGVAATVTAATPSTLTVTVPTTGFTCEPTRDVTVAVTVGDRTGSRQHPLRVAALQILSAGGSVTILDASRVRCNELAATGGRYFISVFNTSTSGFSAIQLRGAAGISAAAATVAAAPAPGPADRVAGGAARRTTDNQAGAPGPQAPGLDLAALRRRRAAHLWILEENLRILDRLGESRRAAARTAPRSTQTEPPPQVGDRLALRIPNPNTGSCSSFSDVTARVVYSGTRAVILEDTVAPLKGTMDSLLVTVGQEFDNTSWGVVEQSFGNPLALDAQLDNNGRVFLLFSKVVNDFGAIEAFVFSGDFLDRSQCAASDKREILYARVPTSSASGFDEGTRGAWMRTIRSTLAHELKHITSFAERISRAAPTEHLWLEESTAMIAEELWARLIFGYSQNANVTYSASLHCEVRPSFPECSGKPFVMYDHFQLLTDYYKSVETRTPIGRIDSNDFTFYGSGWSFVRWSIDQHAASESAFLRALTQESTLAGINNLAARTGKIFEEMLGDWALASTVDDLSDFAPVRSQLRLPSWNTRDIFAGMNRDFPSIFTTTFPLAMRSASFGSFTVDVPTLRGGSFAIFEISGTQSGTQLVEVRSATGDNPPANVRVAIVRVQ
ncbi:MAG: Ig-like domain-containing protein [Gemmatimonadetes bacterium]|nr:Ig-like domain-containing protein [Gemmatimonadota bacterium]